ncbi:TetR/AcrR family transcriptional regulator [Paenibacillus sp. 481]|uniref:TetR/AcrR family transcriptional regulator n=1 Tax=Paenibacillus sp. 481 TaxID=2835869 RepID=UPI001E3D16D4|nr:TetR/AcrR family transcriptional regulator [Paenibacillus sp. 481]UHA71908.1 TetR/AcrR family transcriptional regulator [Paenibacillus sp. 481]
MQNDSIDKKKHIILTAMKLFTSQGYSATTMQEIAQTCEMSKGSLYVHFKSKEELLLNIYKYFHLNIQCQLLQIEHQHHSNPKDCFRMQIEMLLLTISNCREIFLLELQGTILVEHEELKQFKVQSRDETMRWYENKLIAVYGPTIAPYTLDCTIALHGMINSFTQFIIFEKMELAASDLSHYAIRHMDYIAERLIADQPPALVNKEVWKEHLNGQYRENFERDHPIVLVKQMKEQLTELDLDVQQKEDALASLYILEQELKEFQPKRAILLGMLANIHSVPALQLLRERLEHKLAL